MLVPDTPRGHLTCSVREEDTTVELSVTTSRQGDVTIVSVAGEVDVYTAAQLRAALDEEVAADHVQLIVNLDEVTFLDSTGLGVLVGRLKLVRNQSGWLRLVCSNERILRVFRITGLDKVFGIHASLDDALAA
jgi:anti-sigma B factor antagonist